MASIPYDLEAAVMALPREERAALVRRLIDSLDEDDQIEAAWAEEVTRRLAAYREGRIEAFDAEDVHADARKLIKG